MRRPSFPTLLRAAEWVLASGIFLACIVYGYFSLQYFTGVDWALSETFYEVIYRVLLIVIGLELARLLIAHSLLAIPELLAFVIARKLLKPDLTSLDILFGVISFGLILASEHYFFRELRMKSVDDQRGGPENQDQE